MTTTLGLSPQEATNVLKNHGVIAYPTDTIWGLGCLASSPSAIRRILAIKNRSAEKGLILIGTDISQFEPYLQLDILNEDQLARLKNHYQTPTTWLAPAKAACSSLLKGNSSNLGVRLVTHKPTQQLLQLLNEPLISTSANLSGKPTCATPANIELCFGEKIDGVMSGALGGHGKPSKVIEILNNKVIR